MSWQDVTRSSLCSGVKDWGTLRAHNFRFHKSSYRIRRTAVLGMFKDSAIILDAIRRSFLIKSATAAMFTSVPVDFGRPPLSSSSTRSLPSRNREYHLKTFDWFRASFPYVVCANASVSVADRPVLQKKKLWLLPVHFHHPWRIKKTDFTRKVITRTVSKINKQNSVCERMLVDST
jgi:hypothetical protein